MSDSNQLQVLLQHNIKMDTFQLSLVIPGRLETNPVPVGQSTFLALKALNILRSLGVTNNLTQTYLVTTKTENHDTANTPGLVVPLP